MTSLYFRLRRALHFRLNTALQFRSWYSIVFYIHLKTDRDLKCVINVYDIVDRKCNHVFVEDFICELEWVFDVNILY